MMTHAPICPGRPARRLLWPLTVALVAAALSLAGCAADGGPQNQAPTAQVEVRGTAGLGQEIFLSGAGSSDPDGDPLVFRWRLETPASSQAELTSDRGRQSSFIADVPGIYTVTLVVSDGALDSRPDNYIVEVPSEQNQPPRADAGSSQSVQVGQTVQLDASASSDPEGEAITFRWAFDLKPQGSQASLSEPQTSRPSFTPDVAGTYAVELVVTDASGASSTDTVVIEATEPSQNAAPNADISAAAHVEVGQDVVFDGGASSDPDGDTLTYQWQLIASPNTSSATLSGARTSQATLSPDVEGDYTVELTVSDGQASDTARATVVVDPQTVANRAPTADIAAPADAEVGQDVIFDGGASSDPDGDTLTYQWQVTAAPASSAAAVASPTSQTTTLTPDVPGEYTVELTVSDAEASDVAQAVLTVSPAPPQGCLIISEVIEGSSNNKALELYNCGTSQVDLSVYGVCLVSNDGPECDSDLTLDGTLAAGGVTTICNTSLDPTVLGTATCDVSDTVANFNGDDRLFIYADSDASDAYNDTGDVVIDAFGEIASRPTSTIWAEASFRRCNFARFDGSGPFDFTVYYNEITEPTALFDDFGVAPVAGCS